MASIRQDPSWIEWKFSDSQAARDPWGIPNSWMVYNGKILLKWMIQGSPHFRTPPYIGYVWICLVGDILVCWSKSVCTCLTTVDLVLLLKSAQWTR